MPVSVVFARPSRSASPIVRHPNAYKCFSLRGELWQVRTVGIQWGTAPANSDSSCGTPVHQYLEHFPVCQRTFAKLPSGQNVSLPDVVRLRVVSPLLAMNTSTRPREFVTVPAGSIIEISDRIHGPGMVRIRVGDQTLFAASRDIEKHTEPVERSTGG